MAKRSSDTPAEDEETEPEITAEDLMKATEGNEIDTEDDEDDELNDYEKEPEPTDAAKALGTLKGKEPEELKDSAPADEKDKASPHDPALVDSKERAKQVAKAAKGTHADARVVPEGGAVRDVEVATVPKAKGAKEFIMPLTVQDVVVLGKHDAVPARAVGKHAAVISAPRELIPTSEWDDTWITVRVGDEIQSNLSIPLAAVEEVVRG
jgi:hypothetical protein